MYPTDPNGVVLDPTQDGITHINVYSKAQTQLGQELSHFSYSPFAHPVYGDFYSLEAFWHWLATGRCHDHLRWLSGAVAKMTGSAIPRVHLENFEYEFAVGFNYRIDQYPALRDMLVKSTLPFTHYYVMNGNVVVPTKHQWILAVIERRRLNEQ